jgi:hypothetical protein
MLSAHIVTMTTWAAGPSEANVHRRGPPARSLVGKRWGTLSWRWMEPLKAWRER